MIDKRSGRLTHAESNCNAEIGFGIDIATGISNRQSDHVLGKAHRARGMVSRRRSPLKLWLELHAVCHQNGRANAGCIRKERSIMSPRGIEDPVYRVRS
jgi:hypothetical protein